MTDIVMEQAGQDAAATEQDQPCPQPGCIRPAAHPGTRHRYAETKELKKAPEPEPVRIPVPDERPFKGAPERRPTAHAMTLIDEKRGLFVAWDHCHEPSGGCGQHISRCTCATGPKTPNYIQKWRDQQFPIAEPQKVVEVHTQSTGHTINRVRSATDQDRQATHICDSCGELLYLLDTPHGPRAYTVQDNGNYCKVADEGIHFAREITDDDRAANPDWFGVDNDEVDDESDDERDHRETLPGEPGYDDSVNWKFEDKPDVDDVAPVVQATDAPDYDEAAQQEAERTSVQNNIDPEVGF